MSVPRRPGPEVLTEEEWLDGIRTVITRDYFPVAGEEHQHHHNLPSLDAFLAQHTTEDCVAFAELREEEAARKLATNHPARHAAKLLRLKNAEEKKLITNQTTSSAAAALNDPHPPKRQREINARACHVLTSSSTLLPLPASQPHHHRSAPYTKSTTSTASPELSHAAIALAQRLSDKQKKKKPV